jgi:hypothetical protein
MSASRFHVRQQQELQRAKESSHPDAGTAVLHVIKETHIKGIPNT